VVILCVTAKFKDYTALKKGGFFYLNLNRIQILQVALLQRFESKTAEKLGTILLKKQWLVY
jgi:hypothetical protein